jgi:5-oxoprolinase (ATP-hydrolysing)
VTTRVDRGGTFTDVVQQHPDGTVTVQKVPSDVAVVGQLARGELTFGTTVATNALLEGKGVPTLLVVTRGFGDLPWIGDGTRPQLFDADARWPAPLCTRVIEVGGRMGADGVEVEALPEEELAALAGLDLSDVASVAVVLVHSPRNPVHEQAVAKCFEGRLPVSLGHRLSPEVGFLARIETALVDAAITPVLREAMGRDEIPAGALAMASDGGLIPAQELAAPDAVLSGPAGGVLAVAEIARMAGFKRAVGLDMGGTSTDVCRVEAGRLPRREGAVRVAGVRLRRPMLEVETIAAGGGSILSNDGLSLKVGPASAGANPGPACYGRGGPQTLTDAALAVGLVDPEAFDPPLDVDRVDLPGEAMEFLEIARESMAAAVRRLATARGIDLEDHALVSYGGAAGQHAAAVAEKLGIQTVLVHPCAGVLCAWGQSLARREAAGVRPIWQDLDTAWPAVESAWSALQEELPPLGESVATVELRHAGTDHAVEVEARTADSAREEFLREHRRRFGFDRPGASVEVVNARLRVWAPQPVSLALEGDPFGIGDEEREGPLRLDGATTSIFVPPGWAACRKHGLLVLERRTVTPKPEPMHRTPFGVELWSGRFMAVAEQSGEVLRRLARSVNIRERLDFSCAIFDAGGQLVANAPHIPVHLGAMGETVRDLLAHVPHPEPGQAWLTNDPWAGGSHLPDLTVITAVDGGGERPWFVASRAHHVDVGGTTPGSMPPHSRRLEEEGAVLRRVPLVQGGVFVMPESLAQQAREPDVVQADLEAQVAANAHAAQQLVALGEAKVVEAWMAHLHDVAEEAALQVLEGLSPGMAEDVIDGVPLCLSIRPGGGRLEVDFSGTGGPHAGNLNTPPAVVRAAVLYAIRCLVGRPIPLNEGVLRRLRIHLPEPSILSPPPGSAIVGGNVETSQRITDLFLRAAGARAGSQGTMNNLTLGSAGWSFYETICGGVGASPSRSGDNARQVHMTNTRATDVEVLETRLPLRLWGYSRRSGSGGEGAHTGGDGACRELEVLDHTRVSLLASRRTTGAPGLGGGGEGEAGRDSLRVGGSWRDWDGSTTDLAPGDRVRVRTPGGGGWGAA